MKDHISLIQHLDLQYLIDRMVNKYSWEPVAAKETVRKYKNFLTLKYVYPDLEFAPRREIDEIWHQHILFTKNYMRDCELIFGKYIHHTPSLGTAEERRTLDKRFVESARIYEDYFQEPYGYTIGLL